MSVSKVKIGSVTHDIKDTLSRERSIEFIKGTQTAKTGAWTGVTTKAELYDGMTISYWLPYAGSGNATLELTFPNGTTSGAKPVYLYGTTRVTTHYSATSIVGLVYVLSKDGWFVNTDKTTDANTCPSAYCSTAAGTAAKVATCNGYALRPGNVIHTVFTATNTAASALTLNINSTGAKPLWINGAASSSSNHELPAGSYILRYDGTAYLLRTDGKSEIDIVGSVNGYDVNKSVPSDAVFTDTTYDPMSQNEATAGLATDQKTISPKVLKDTITANINMLGVTNAMQELNLLVNTISAQGTYTLIDSITNYNFVCFVVGSGSSVIDFKTIPTALITGCGYGTEFIISNNIFYTIAIAFNAANSLSITKLVGDANYTPAIPYLYGIKI